jgi:CubicO group peptidase (beta-lactamase class C family)
VHELDHAVDEVAAATDFSGVVRVDVDGEVELAKAFGLADRGHAIANTLDTQFGVASGAKGLTAVAVAALIEDGSLALTTTARSVLGADLPLIGDDVTVEHLLAHRSGVGDYLDEDTHQDVDDYVMPVPVQELATTEDYLAVLDGHPAKFRPDARFAYCNGGYVVLALIAERTSGIPFHERRRRSLVPQRARSGATTHAHGDLEHVDGSVADRAPAAGPADALGRATAGAPRP